VKKLQVLDTDDFLHVLLYDCSPQISLVQSDGEHMHLCSCLLLCVVVVLGVMVW